MKQDTQSLSKAIFVHVLVLVGVGSALLMPSPVTLALALGSIATLVAHHTLNTVNTKLERDLDTEIQAAIDKASAEVLASNEKMKLQVTTMEKKVSELSNGMIERFTGPRQVNMR